MSRLNWSYLVNTAITGTSRKMLQIDRQFIKLCLDVPFLSGQISSKCFKSSDGRSLTIETQYLTRNPYVCTVTDTETVRKVQTISRAISSSIPSPATFDGQTLAQSSAHLCRQPRSHESHGIHNLDDSKRRFRVRCYACHAASRIVTISRHRQE